MVPFLREYRCYTGVSTAESVWHERRLSTYKRESEVRSVSNANLDRFLASVEKDAYRLALAACRDPDEAVDLVQDAMLTLVKKYRHKPEAQWPPLFHRILQNRFRDWFRRQSVQHALLKWTGLGDTQEQLENIKAPSPSDPEYIGESDVSLAQIETLIQRLPPRQQQVLLLRTWQELSVSETAKAMSISESSVKTHHARALAALKKALTPDNLMEASASHE